jgi:hypothetical protein
MPLLHSNMQVLLPNCCVGLVQRSGRNVSVTAHDEKAADLATAAPSSQAQVKSYACSAFRYTIQS